MTGAELRHLNPDERSTAALFLKALRIESMVESASTPGVYISGIGFAKLLETLGGPFVLLKEDGEDIRRHRIPSDAVFVLSDHLDFVEEEEKVAGISFGWPVDKLHLDRPRGELDRPRRRVVQPIEQPQ